MESHIHRGVEQLVARWAHNPKVTGSSPVPATKRRLDGRFFRFMLFYVYVLHSAECDKIYIGFTSDLAARIKSHNSLATKGWTKKFRPWTVVHTEVFDSKDEAMRREKGLKSAQGREFIRRKILKQIT